MYMNEPKKVCVGGGGGCVLFAMHDKPIPTPNPQKCGNGSAKANALSCPLLWEQNYRMWCFPCPLHCPSFPFLFDVTCL